MPISVGDSFSTPGLTRPNSPVQRPKTGLPAAPPQAPAPLSKSAYAEKGRGLSGPQSRAVNPSQAAQQVSQGLAQSSPQALDDAIGHLGQSGALSQEFGITPGRLEQARQHLRPVSHSAVLALEPDQTVQESSRSLRLKTDSAPYDSSRLPGPTGRLDIVGHGSSDGLTVGGRTPEQLAQKLLADFGSREPKQLDTIRLVSCDSKAFAQAFSQALQAVGIEVRQVEGSQGEIAVSRASGEILPSSARPETHDGTLKAATTELAQANEAFTRGDAVGGFKALQAAYDKAAKVGDTEDLVTVAKMQLHFGNTCSNPEAMTQGLHLTRSLIRQNPQIGAAFGDALNAEGLCNLAAQASTPAMARAAIELVMTAHHGNATVIAKAAEVTMGQAKALATSQPDAAVDALYQVRNMLRTLPEEAFTASAGLRNEVALLAGGIAAANPAAQPGASRDAIDLMHSLSADLPGTRAQILEAAQGHALALATATADTDPGWCVAGLRSLLEVHADTEGDNLELLSKAVGLAAKIGAGPPPTDEEDRFVRVEALELMQHFAECLPDSAKDLQDSTLARSADLLLGLAQADKSRDSEQSLRALSALTEAAAQLPGDQSKRYSDAIGVAGEIATGLLSDRPEVSLQALGKILEIAAATPPGNEIALASALTSTANLAGKIVTDYLPKQPEVSLDALETLSQIVTAIPGDHSGAQLMAANLAMRVAEQTQSSPTLSVQALGIANQLAMGLPPESERDQQTVLQSSAAALAKVTTLHEDPDLVAEAVDQLLALAGSVPPEVMAPHLEAAAKASVVLLNTQLKDQPELAQGALESLLRLSEHLPQEGRGPILDTVAKGAAALFNAHALDNPQLAFDAAHVLIEVSMQTGGRLETKQVESVGSSE